MATAADFSEFHRLGVDFGHAAGSAVRVIDKVVEKGAVNIKDTMSTDAANDGHYKRFAASISYERWYGVGSIAYVVGPDKDRAQGALGNILYFGTSKNGAVLDVEVGMRKEAPLLERNLGETAERLAAGRG